MRPTRRAAAGFTLLELVIAIAIFALLGLGCWRLFDAVVRVERSSIRGFDFGGYSAGAGEWLD